MAEENNNPTPNTEENVENNPTSTSGGSNNKNGGLIATIIILSILLVVAIFLALFFGLRNSSSDDTVNPDPDIVEPGPAEDHLWDDGEIIVNATCTEKGMTLYTCLECGFAKVDEDIPALGHSYETTYSSDESGHWYACSRCGDIKEGSYSEHVSTYSEQDGFHTEYCSICGQIIADSGHNWEATGNNTVYPTCTESGSIEYECSYCHAIQNVLIAATGHSHTSGGYLLQQNEVDGVAEGLIEFTCDMCGLLYAETQELHFATDSWETINSYSEAGTASDRYFVGETKDITMTGTNGGGSDLTDPIPLRIIDLNHDDLTEGGKAGLTIETSVSISGYTLNSTTNGGAGWEGCDLRAMLQPESETNTGTDAGKVYKELPDDLTPYIKTVDKISYTCNSTSVYTPHTTQDKLFLLSVAEVYSETAIKNSTDSNGMSSYADQYINEGSQYELYANAIGDHNPAQSYGEPVLKLRESGSYSNDWFLRTSLLNSVNSSYFYYVDDMGCIEKAPDNDPMCLSFAFCI